MPGNPRAAKAAATILLESTSPNERRNHMCEELFHRRRQCAQQFVKILEVGAEIAVEFSEESRASNSPAVS